jgi:hypothetical protein
MGTTQDILTGRSVKVNATLDRRGEFRSILKLVEHQRGAVVVQE